VGATGDMADVVFVLLTALLFVLVGFVIKGVERL
jgi:hypothetical protein